MSASSFFRKLAMELDGGASVGKGLGFPAASVHWGMVDGGLPCRVVLILLCGGRFFTHPANESMMHN